MIDSESACAIAFQTENLTPPKVMPRDHRKLLKDGLNGDAALDTAGTAKEGVLQISLVYICQTAIRVYLQYIKSMCVTVHQPS